MRIAKEAWPFAGPVGALSALALALGHPLVAAALLPVLGFTLWFFRDPERVAPAAADALLSPADGRIIRSGPGSISIFMSLVDVHVCRSPLAGRVASVEHVPGRFLAAFRDPASEQNERVSIVVDGGPRPVRLALVAGLLARRIVCKVAPGQQLQAGERIGLIRFGSRVDLFLPPGARPLVALGERVVAGRTPVARCAAGPGAAPRSEREDGSEPVPSGSATRGFPI